MLRRVGEELGIGSLAYLPSCDANELNGVNLDINPPDDSEHYFTYYTIPHCMFYGKCVSNVCAQRYSLVNYCTDESEKKK